MQTHPHLLTGALRWLAAAGIATALAVVPLATRASMGLTELPGLQGDGPVTVFYPASVPAQTVHRGVFTFELALDAPPERGNGRLVVVSHGSGGAPWVHVDLARALVEAGFTVALPQHRHDHNRDHSQPGPESWKRRPAEASRAVDAVARSPLGALLQLDRVGLFGGSAGGHTVFSIAGGRWSPASFRRHCEAHIEEDFSSCVGYITRLRGNWLDGLKKQVALGALRQRFDDETWYTHDDARFAAAVAAVPFAADFDMDSLARPRIPLGLVIAGRDINQVPRFHIGAVRQACAGCETVADIPEASHGVMLSPMPPAHVVSEIAQELNGDPPGFDRARVIPALNAAITRFFIKHLEPRP